MPSKRTTHTLDYGTGKLTVTESIHPDGTVAERFAALRETSENAVGPGVSVMRVLCDGCGCSVVVRKPELPESWTTNEKGEFCPRCSGA